MRWMAVIAAGLAAPALAQTVPPSPAPPASATHDRSVQLSKVVLDTQGGEIKGKLKVGTICLFGGGKMTVGKDKSTQDYERYDTLFSQSMGARGYRVVSTSADLFSGEGNAPKGDVLIGATMKIDELNLCSSVNGEKGDVTVSIAWQVFDRTAGRVVASATTTGRGVEPKFKRDGLLRLLDAGFLAGLNALVDGDTLRGVPGLPVPAPVTTVAAPATPTATTPTAS